MYCDEYQRECNVGGTPFNHLQTNDGGVDVFVQENIEVDSFNLVIFGQYADIGSIWFARNVEALFYVAQNGYTITELFGPDGEIWFNLVDEADADKMPSILLPQADFGFLGWIVNDDETGRIYRSQADAYRNWCYKVMWGDEVYATA